ncbi:hypothetical protein H8I69_23130 [Serratia fonticola]|uniref:hypothetical protein n=1 Tax=Serratia fonticola TaxID=47917 RepID=UPI0015C65B3A|nr:hypothetical protein [Serratia fonticola]MBC3382012.1 hypothetical protein [Serratia fonticola]NYA41211.1 hypothetical protein [Serratia fonticola]
MALPERHYYPLDLAAKKLKCDVNDLLHYASIGLLELCVSMPKRPNSDKESGSEDCIEKDENLDKKYYKPDIRYVNRNKIDKDASSLKIRYETINTSIVATYNVRKDTYGMVGIRGILAIPFTNVKNIDCIDTEFIEPYYLTLPRTEMKVAVTENISIEKIFFEKTLKIKKDFLVITSEELMLLNNGGKNLIDSSFLKSNKEVVYFASEKKTESKKSENLKSEFIKGLLLIKYGEKVAENPRSYLDNDKSQISIDFLTKGLTPPSGVTVNGWLK